MIKLIIPIITLITLSFFVSSYYVGNDYGVDVIKMNKLLSSIPVEYFDGLDSIYFSNSEVRFRGEGTGEGRFDFWDCGRTTIRIGMFNNNSLETNKFVLLHELGHLDELMNNDEWHKVNLLNESYADDFAYKNMNMFEVKN